MSDPTPLTHKASRVAQAQVDFLRGIKDSLGIQKVYYGDQRQIPDVPAVCIEPTQVARDLRGIPYQTENEFTTAILVYHTSLEGTETIQHVCDNIAEAVADALNAEGLPPPHGTGTRFGGIILRGFVTRHEYGYRVLADELMRVNRLIWEGMTKTPLMEA